MKFIGIIGSRKRNDHVTYLQILAAFQAHYEEGDWIVSGGCPEGGDAFAEEIAKDHGIPILIFYPNWKKFARGAGFVRNSDIAHHSDMIIASVHRSRKGGTEDTLAKFKKKFGPVLDEGEYLIDHRIVLV